MRTASQNIILAAAQKKAITVPCQFDVCHPVFEGLICRGEGQTTQALLAILHF